MLGGRGGALLIQAILGSVMIGATLYLAVHLQLVMGLAPFHAGLASPPLTLAIMIVAPIATKLLPVMFPRPMMIGGPVLVASGYSASFAIAALGMVAAAIIAAFMIRATKSELLPQGGEPVLAHAGQGSP